MIPYPQIDPVLIRIGPLAIRWYSLAYIAGIMLGWWYIACEVAKKPIRNLTKNAFDDMVVWAVVGIVLGGRLGYVLFYKPGYYFAHPAEILYVWQGGMSFHGGMIGFIIAFFLFCRKYKVPFFELMDLLACAAPLGLGFGRLANFINGELYGRVTDVPWAMVFPHGGAPNGENWPRHPSQLYEAGLEGVALFTILFIFLKFTRTRDYTGRLCGIFLVGYSFSRIFVECFREPDDFLGFFFGSMTMGQLLSVPMLLLGVYLIVIAKPDRIIIDAPRPDQAAD